MLRNTRRELLGSWMVKAGTVVLAVAGLHAVPAAAVDTDIAIDRTAVDFGVVGVGQTAQVAVTLTNTGSDPFGPVNMFGGAPPTNEFNASQNCQGTTLPAGGSCMITYSFSPGSAGPFTDTSSFTVSETSSQSDGEDFSVTLAGVGFDPNATTTTSTTTSPTSPPTATTSTTSPATTTPTTAAPGGGQPATTSPPTTPTSTTTTTTTEPLIEREPLTGIVIEPRPALVVKVDNVDA